jgi:type II secretory pathway pseudopilin PulG
MKKAPGRSSTGPPTALRDVARSAPFSGTRTEPSRGATRLRSACRLKDEGGFSLVEELVALAIVVLGLGFVLAAIGTASFGLRETDQHVFAENLARSQLERIKDAAYSANPTTVPYPNISPPAGYSLSVGVEYWTAPNGPFVATVRNDGLQRITVTVHQAGQDVLAAADYKVNR